MKTFIKELGVCHPSCSEMIFSILVEYVKIYYPNSVKVFMVGHDERGNVKLEFRAIAYFKDVADEAKQNLSAVLYGAKQAYYKENWGINPE